ncbi:hypothetical protein [Georgenia satyanarayanai]|nr:hypothetical protein [Georgenia satyanarayanai]
MLNVLGGIVLVTTLRVVRSKELVVHFREQAPEDPDAAHER